MCVLACALTPEQRRQNEESFEYVWKTVRDKHWEKAPAGLNWQAIHAEFRPALDKADSMEQARAVMSAMLARLQESHFAIIPAQLYEDLDDAHPPGEGVTGIDLRVVGNAVLVTSVDEGSGAAAAGVHPGWEILAVAGHELAPVVAKASEAYQRSTLRELTLRRVLLRRMQGQPGTALEVRFRDGEGRAVIRKIEEGKPKGTVTQFGFLAESVWMETGRRGDVGFVRFNLFLDPARLMPAFGRAVEACTDCKGFVVDLRGNAGGLGAMAMGMAGWFIGESGRQLGTLQMRDSAIHFVVYPRAMAFRGPLAILVDGASASTSEILAGGLKDLGRARIFGTPTAAAALPSVVELLPNGDAFQYAVANYISAGGKPLEGAGVTPDEATPVTREALLAGRDPAFDAAVRWINGQ